MAVDKEEFRKTLKEWTNSRKGKIFDVGTASAMFIGLAMVVLGRDSTLLLLIGFSIMLPAGFFQAFLPDVYIYNQLKKRARREERQKVSIGSDESKLTREFDEKLDKFSKDFHRVSPFGRAGSDKEFAEVARLFEEFYAGWKSWYSKKKS